MMTFTRRPNSTRRAVTLLEIVLAMGLLVVVSSMTFWFYSSTLETRERGTRETHKLRLVRVIVDRISTEIRQASAITTSDRVGIRGEAERIWLSTLRVPSRELSKERRTDEEPPPAEYDLVKVEYKIARHPDILDESGFEQALGIARVELRIPRPDTAQTGEAFEGQGFAAGSKNQGDALDEFLSEEGLLDDLEDSDGAGIGPEIAWEELYAPEIHYLRFCYFDGHQWWDDWDIGGKNPLPQLVMVAVGFEGYPPFGEEFGHTENLEFCTCMNEDPVECEPLPADQFAVTVRVAQSDPLFRSRIGRETQAFIDRLSGEE